MAERRVLPARREGETFDLVHGNQRNKFTVTVSCFSDGSPAEVFITGPKVGSETEAIARDGAILLSLALQYGVPLYTMRHAITRNEQGQADTVIGRVIDQMYMREP